MIRGEFETASEESAAALRSAYDERMRAVIESIGVDTVVEESGVDRATVDALAAGESLELTVEEAATVLAVDEGYPDADTVEMEALDILLMGMTTAVVDVDAVSAGLDGEMEPKEIQQKIEGRYPMTLDEYASVHHFLSSRS
jgi:hypothetical protein